MSKPKTSLGRPTKLTSDLQAKVISYIQAGAYIETAAAAAGIAKDTFYAWLKLGAAQRTGKHRDFSDAVEKALAESELVDVNRINKAAAGAKAEYDEKGNLLREETKANWQASAWRLERKFPDRWGRREKLEHSGPGGGPIRSRETTVIEIRKAAHEAVKNAGEPSEDY